jgi:pSer/pThr/pTyr-binding forkhead associated (FHA) protein
MNNDYEENYDNKAPDPGKRVTGWLVGIDDPCTGKDYRICPGYNWVGSDQTMDIIIPDASVADTHHCAIVYDERHNTTFLVAQEGRDVFLNDQPVSHPLPLEADSLIRIGSIRFYYIPFCFEERSWKTICSL